jgi:ribose 5-phosphate isomerase B
MFKMMINKICIGSDHAGFELKSKLIKKLELEHYKVIDKGCFSNESIDYADYAHPVAHYVEDHVNVIGILLCGSGNGISMTANKHKGIRSAICWKEEIAKLAREHNDANILTLPARFISEEDAYRIVDVFLSTSFEGGRHQKRIEKIPL